MKVWVCLLGKVLLGNSIKKDGLKGLKTKVVEVFVIEGGCYVNRGIKNEGKCVRNKNRRVGFSF